MPAWARKIPLPIRPPIQRRDTTLRIGYFGDSTTRGAWYNGNPAPYPDNYTFLHLAGLIQATLAEYAPLEVREEGNDAVSGALLLTGGLIRNDIGSIRPFAERLQLQPYDAVIVGVGICDALYGHTPEQFRQTLAGLYATARDAGIPIVFETPNPVPTSTISPLVESYRPLYAAYDLVIDQNQPTEMSDAFHPTIQGYGAKVERVASVLRSAMTRRFMLIEA
ncbi:SGNH/GDSL hydrolase family protein [Piscinibacter sakaiensis]|uniref:SGNH/GDSL hydrolase family protein n=1 Tax=Piscinibacter sakaiensis TaxID=1547922 RepID=UPI00372B8908